MLEGVEGRGVNGEKRCALTIQLGDASVRGNGSRCSQEEGSTRLPDCHGQTWYLPYQPEKWGGYNGTSLLLYILSRLFCQPVSRLI